MARRKALSSGQKTAIVVGGAALIGGLVYFVGRKSGPSITLNPSTVAVGFSGNLTVSGTGFTPNSQTLLDIYGGGVLLTELVFVLTTLTGTFSGTATLSDLNQAEQIEIKVIDGSDLSASATLTVTS